VGPMPQGEVTKEMEFIVPRQDLSAPLEPQFPFRCHLLIEIVEVDSE